MLEIALADAVAPLSASLLDETLALVLGQFARGVIGRQDFERGGLAGKAQLDLSAGDAKVLEGCAEVAAARVLGVGQTMQLFKPLRVRDWASRRPIERMRRS